MLPRGVGEMHPPSPTRPSSSGNGNVQLVLQNTENEQNKNMSTRISSSTTRTRTRIRRVPCIVVTVVSILLQVLLLIQNVNSFVSTGSHNQGRWNGIHGLTFQTKHEKKSPFYYKKYSRSVSSVLLVLFQSTKDKRKTYDYYKRKNPLIPVLDSILYYGQHIGQSSSLEQTPTPELLEVLQRLKSARYPSEIQQIGQLLIPDLLSQQSIPIQERLLKALALAGLLDQAMTLLQSMLNQEKYLPSYISYTALLSALRQAKRTEDIFHILLELNRVAQQHKKSIHVMAMNLYLAALCDDPTTMSSLDEASQWILNPKRTDELFGVPLDLTSYNTILHAAAKRGNQTLVDAVWTQLSSLSVSSSPSLQPDIRSYNARLLATHAYDQRLEIGEELLQANLLPDRYTMDLLLLPMLLMEQQDRWEQLLDAFIERHSDLIVRDAMSAFLNTLVHNGKLEYAKHLLDVYIIPTGSTSTFNLVNNNNHNTTRTGSTPSKCPPDTRHFNILIDGYRRQAENSAIAAASQAVAMYSTEFNNNDNNNNNKDDTGKDTEGNGLLQAQYFSQQEQVAKMQGRTMFIQMKKIGILPDSYTLTSMMGLCERSAELIALLTNPLWQNRISPAVIRSAITSSGQLGDPGLATALFDRYAFRDKFIETSPRLWNVLLGALSDGAEQGNRLIDLESDAIRELMKSPTTMGETSQRSTSMSQLLQGKTCTEAVRYILHLLDKKANAQSYCVAAAALQYDPKTGPDLAMSLFQNATIHGIPADGRFVNAVFRCFGEDIDQALAYWKTHLRQACLRYESRPRDQVSDKRSPQKNLIAAYNGLIHVCGRAHRPDIAVRLVYAMNRDGIEPNEVTLNNYRAGKRLRKQPPTATRRFLSLPTMVQQYENILYVECTKYNQYNKRMSKDRRVRIIV